MKRATLIGFAAIALALGACKRDPEIAIITPPAETSASSKPIDHLAPNELLEGDAKAFGLVLPRGMRVDAAFADVAFASGHVPVPGAVQYVRTHVREGKMIEPSFAGDGRTTFDKVRVPALPDRVLVISVRELPGAPVGTTQIELHDVTPTKAPELPDEAARWRNAGLAPNGRVLDPTELR